MALAIKFAFSLGSVRWKARSRSRSNGRRSVDELSVYKDIPEVISDFVPFAQFKNCEKHSWGGVTFSAVVGRSLKVTQLHGYFSRFLNCTSHTESSKASHLVLINIR